MGLSNFLKRKKDEPKVSAFDQIPLSAQDAIVEDIILFIQDIKTWPNAACISAEHKSALIAESLNLFRSLGTAIVTAAVNPFADKSEDDEFNIAAALKRVEFPATLKSMVGKIVNYVNKEPNGPQGTPAEPTTPTE